jgi:hypothetical protein
VDEVVGVMEENVGDGKSVFQLPMPDECHGADDSGVCCEHDPCEKRGNR